ncbi:unnamed protein product [Choristocarpus tenellus]
MLSLGMNREPISQKANHIGAFSVVLCCSNNTNYLAAIWPHLALLKPLPSRRNVSCTADTPKIYDVTKYLDDHPGGVEVMLEVGGEDATNMFEDIGHSQDARTEMKKFQIGTLKRLLSSHHGHPNHEFSVSRLESEGGSTQ